MDDILTVYGNRALSGSVHVAGFKHALVTISAAALAADCSVTIENCPDIEETQVIASLLSTLGASASYDGRALKIDARNTSGNELDPIDAARIHGSVYLLPALLARSGSAVLPESGGCQISNAPGGKRPIHHYLDIFNRFGASVTAKEDGRTVVSAAKLLGCEIDLLDYTADPRLRTGPLYSGATKTALLTAAVAHGVSVLHSPYPKPDVTELVAVLRQLGVSITELGDGTLLVEGTGGPLSGGPAVHRLIPDLIEVATWICAGTLFGDRQLKILGTDMTGAARALAPDLEVLDRMGALVEIGPQQIVVSRAPELRSVDVVISSHGVFSDNQPFLALLAAYATGESSITETVWTARFGYADGLAALGIRVERRGRVLFVHGPWAPRPSRGLITAGDLRAAAALLLAALAVPARTQLAGMRHLRRGYPDLPGALCSLGADITAEKDTSRARQLSGIA